MTPFTLRLSHSSGKRVSKKSARILHRCLCLLDQCSGCDTKAKCSGCVLPYDADQKWLQAKLTDQLTVRVVCTVWLFDAARCVFIITLVVESFAEPRVSLCSWCWIGTHRPTLRSGGKRLKLSL